VNRWLEIEDLGAESERIPRHRVKMEISVGHLGQHHAAAVVDRIGHEEAGGLRHSLHDQGVGHECRSRKVIVHVVFGQRHVLDRHGGAAAHELIKTIDPKPAHEAIPAGAGHSGFGADCERRMKNRQALSSQLALHVADHVFHSERIGKILHVGIGFELGQVGKRHAGLQRRQTGRVDLSIGNKFRTGKAQLCYLWLVKKEIFIGQALNCILN
jgi:hypothetical protein